MELPTNVYGLTSELSNGLSLKPDWFAFTFTDQTDCAIPINWLGYTLDEFENSRHGSQGYQSMLRNQFGMRILYNGRSDMGCHVDIPGSAIPDVLEHFSGTLKINTPFGEGYEVSPESSVLFEFLDMILSHGGTFTRIDLAIDDVGAKYYTLEMLKSVLDEGRFVSFFKDYKEIQKKNMSGKKLGYTINIGERSSETMLRVYDKQAEQNRRRPANDQLDMPWIRWEIELKKGQATRAAKALVEKKDVAAVFLGILNLYFRIIYLDKAEPHRCTIDKTWAAFINGVQPLRLSIPKPETGLEELKKWLVKQVFPALAAVVIAEGSMDFITSNLQKASNRLNSRYRKMIAAENPAYRDNIIKKGAIQ